MKVLPIICTILALSLQAQPWQADKAATRIRFYADRFRYAYLFIPVPAELADKTADVIAFDDAGTRLPATPIFNNGKLLGATIQSAKTTAPKEFKRPPMPAPEAPAASLYLLTEKDPKPVPVAGSRPVRVERQPLPLTTRAHTAEEMLRMFENLYQIPFPQALNRPHRQIFRSNSAIGFCDFGDVRYAAEWSAPPNNGHFMHAFSIWKALINIDKPQKIAFGTNQSQMAWTVLLDAKPVANWTGQEILPDNSTFGPFVDLTPGLHTVQLLIAQAHGEPLPQLLTKTDAKDAKPQPLANLLPPRTSPLIGVDVRAADGKVTSLGCITLFEQDAFALTHFGNSLISLYETAKTPVPNTRFTTADGTALTAANGLLIAQGDTQPRIVFQPQPTTTYTFAMPPAWERSRAIIMNAHLEAPPLHDATKPLPLEVVVTIPQILPPEALAQLSLTAEQRDAKGQPLASQTAAATGVTRLSLTLHEQAASVVVTPHLGNAIPFAPLTLSLIAPAQCAAHQLAPQGRKLTEQPSGTVATLVLPANIQAQSSVISETKTTDQPVVLYDDFLTVSAAPGATLTFPKAAAERTDLQQFSFTFPAGTDRRLPFLASLPALLASKPDTAITFVRPDLDANPLSALALRYFIQVCNAHHVRPLVVLPPQTTQTAAYAAKNLALADGAAILDLYAQAILNKLDTSDWNSANGVRINSINDAARAWLFQQLLK